MTRHHEPSGSSSRLQAPLTIRPAPGASFTANESNEQHIQNATNEGKNISGLLADILKRSSLANNKESNLHQVLSLAEELRNYKSPAEFTIGLVGDSGVGKSSLINSLLDLENLAKTAGAGKACTTTVTEYRRKRDGDNAAYTVEIECMGNQEMEDLLRQSVVDYRRYHLLDQNDSERPENGEVEKLQVKAKQAWDTLKAAFEHHDGCTEILFQNAGVSTEELTRMLLGWKDQLIWPAEFNTNIAVLTAGNVPDCVARIEEFLEAWMWPFIKVVRIYLDAIVLQNGIILVDLPGFRDVNSARVRITEMRLHQCDEIFMVTDIGRAATNKGVEDLVIRQLGKNFNSLKRSQGVAIICTKSEDLGQESEILRDVPHTNDFNPQVVGSLERQIVEAEENDEPSMELKARRLHLFISARNEHVKGQLMRHYASQRQIRTINVYCVSNKLYRKAANQQSLVQQIRNRRRSSNSNDRSLAADQMLRSSGIHELRDFIQGIPSKSQIAETRHFLNTRLLTLFEKTDMWLNASVPGIAANQPPAPGFVQDLQTELKTKFDTIVETSHAELINAKTQMLHRPLSLTPDQGMNRWEGAALVAVSRWERWHHATFLSFWNHEGAHETKSQPWVDWNEEIIRAMVDDVQPSAEPFRAENERSFETLSESTHQGLSLLSTRLGELHLGDNFIETFPRRRRNLDYETENITNWFFDELETIFHDLLRAHGTSYVMQCMLPMYNEIDLGSGVTKTRIGRLKLQISGDRNNPQLFKAIRDLFIAALSALLENTKEKLQEAVDKCYADIGHDLELVRGEGVPTSDEDHLIGMMFDVLEEAGTRRVEALREFEAGVTR